MRISQGLSEWHLVVSELGPLKTSIQQTELQRDVIAAVLAAGITAGPRAGSAVDSASRAFEERGDEASVVPGAIAVAAVGRSVSIEPCKGLHGSHRRSKVKMSPGNGEEGLAAMSVALGLPSLGPAP